MELDVLILGGGSAGSVLANRLSANPACHVALIEAGSEIIDPAVQRPEMWPSLQGRNYDWAYTTTSQPGLSDRQIDWPRGQGWGGSSNLHAMAHMRGSREDFDGWADATKDDRWSWEGLLPYFRKMETYYSTSPYDTQYHGNSGPLPVLLPDAEQFSPLVASYLAGWQELGVKQLPGHNTGNMIGATLNALTIHSGQRVSASTAYLDPVRHRPNLRLYDYTTVHRLAIFRGRVTGVEVVQGGKCFSLSAKRVIVAMGSIATPLLLMRSGIGDPRVLNNAEITPLIELPEVGKNLHDHLLAAGNTYRSKRYVPPTKTQISESMTYLSSSGLDVTEGKPDVVVGCSVAPAVSEAIASPLEQGSGFSLLFGVTHPTSRGSIEVTGPHFDSPPKIDPAYLTTEYDRVTFRKALEYAREVGNTRSMSEWIERELLPGEGIKDTHSIDEFISRAAITHHHPVGTCRMGADSGAVVDSNLRVNGVQNLYVVDASVIPTITAGPVHAPVLAIAEAFADWSLFT